MHQRPRVVQTLHNEHIYMSGLLEALEEQITELAAGEDPDVNLILDVLHYMTSFPDRFHHPREDLVYELLAERESSIRPLLLELQKEHPQLEELAAEASDCVDDYRALATDNKRAKVVESCTDYISMLRQHMDQEEAGVLPIAGHLLSAEDWLDIDKKFSNYSDLPVVDQVTAQIDNGKQKVHDVIYKGKDELLLANVLISTAALERFGAAMQGFKYLSTAIKHANASNRQATLALLKSFSPASQEKMQVSATNLINSIASGVKQVSASAKSGRDKYKGVQKNSQYIYDGLYRKRLPQEALNHGE